ncbi:MAG: GlpM family protein [Planctomycetota bacterium]
MWSYVILFVSTGSLAVAFKVLGERSDSALAGLVAMVPLKIVVAWWVLSSVGGADALRASIPGMAKGLVAIVAYLATGWLLAHRASPAVTIGAATLAWTAVAYALAGRG